MFPILLRGKFPAPVLGTWEMAVCSSDVKHLIALISSAELMSTAVICCSYFLFITANSA